MNAWFRTSNIADGWSLFCFWYKRISPCHVTWWWWWCERQGGTQEIHHQNTTNSWNDVQRVTMPCCPARLLTAQHRGKGSVTVLPSDSRTCVQTWTSGRVFNFFSPHRNLCRATRHRTPQPRIKRLLFIIRKYQSWGHNSFALSSAKFNT